MPADSGPGEGALPGWQPADSLLCPHKGAVGSGLYGGSPDKDTNPIGLGLHLYGLTELLIISFDFFLSLFVFSCTGSSLLHAGFLRVMASKGDSLSCSAACGIFPDQGSDPYPAHWQVDSLTLGNQGSPLITPTHPH